MIYLLSPPPPLPPRVPETLITSNEPRDIGIDDIIDAIFIKKY